MGREQRERQYGEAADEAEFERAIGPMRDFEFYSGGCPSCGHPTRALRHCRGKDLLHPEKPRQCVFVGTHLHAMCERCGDIWAERTKDDPENGKAEPASQ